MKNQCKTSYLISFLSIWFTGCWERQDINLLRPEIPYYSLLGYTVDIDDSTLIIPTTPISIVGVQMLYDVTFDPITIESDSSGYFQIDTVYPGNYIISAERDGFNVVSENITVNHEDKPYDLDLPKPLLTYIYYRSPAAENPRFAFQSGSLWIMSNIKDPRPPEDIIQSLFNYTISINGLSKIRWVRVPFIRPGSIEYANGLIYFYSNGYVAYLRPEDQTIWELVLLDTFEIDDPLNDMVWDGSGFWSTYGNSIQYRGRNLRSIEDSWDVAAGTLGALTRKGDYFWTYDKDRDLLLKLNHRGKVLLTYRPINLDTRAWVNIYDMDISPFGTLWVTDKSSPWIHEFNLHDLEDIN